MILALCSTSQTIPPHGITHSEKYEELYQEFYKHNWSRNQPPLVGIYEGNPVVRLLTGSHRYLRPNMRAVCCQYWC